MKKNNEIEVPEEYFERKPIILLISVVITSILIYLCFRFFTDEIEMHGWALILVTPALIALFQTLTFILSPYVLVFKDRFEIKKHLLSGKTWYFNDIAAISEKKGDSFIITYNDGEEEKFGTKGLKASHVEKLMVTLRNRIKESAEKRKSLI